MRGWSVLLAGILVAVLPIVSHAADRPWEQLRPEVERLASEQRYTELAAIADEALRAAEQTFGPNDPHVAALITTLGQAHRLLAIQAIATYGRDEALLKRTLRIVEQARGPDHPDVATAVNNLGELYSLQANYREAEPLFQRALGIWERTNGPNDPHVAIALNNLAWLYKVQGRDTEAESLYRRALSIFKRAHLTRHPTYAVLTTNLSALLKAQDKRSGTPPQQASSNRGNAEEEAAYRRKLEALEDTLGPNHPNVADALKDLAGFYAAQRRPIEAEASYQRALAIDEQGTDEEAQKKVRSTLNQLIVLYRTQHRDAEAEPLYERLLALLERQFGPKHADLIPVLERYAECLEAVDKPSQADAARSRASRIRQKPER